MQYMIRVEDLENPERQKELKETSQIIQLPGDNYLL